MFENISNINLKEIIDGNEMTHIKYRLINVQSMNSIFYYYIYSFYLIIISKIMPVALSEATRLRD